MAKSETPDPLEIKAVHIGGDTIADRLIPHAKKIAIAVLVIAAVLTVIFTIRWWKHRGEIQETAALAKGITVIDRGIVTPPTEPVTEPPPAGRPEADPTFANRKARAESALATLGTAGLAKAGALVEASLRLDAGQLDQARAAYTRAANAAGLTGVNAREGLGLVAEAEAAAAADEAGRVAAFERALTSYRAMQPDAAGPRRDAALYHEGRLLLLLNKPAEAKPLLEQVVRDFATSPFSGAASRHLAGAGA